MRRTLLVGVGLDVPVSEGITGVVALVTSYFDLLETPLRKIDIGSPQIASHSRVLQSESSGQSSNLALVTGGDIFDDLDLPMVLVITDGKITVAGNFLLALANRGCDVVGVEISSCLRVNQANNVAVSNKSRLFFRVIVRLGTVGVKPPFVVGILVVVAGNLLLS